MPGHPMLARRPAGFIRVVYTLAACVLSAVTCAAIFTRSAPTLLLERITVWIGVPSVDLGAIRHWLADGRAVPVGQWALNMIFLCLLIGYVHTREDIAHGLWIPTSLLAVAVLVEAAGPRPLMTAGALIAVFGVAVGAATGGWFRVSATIGAPVLYTLFYVPAGLWRVLAPRQA